MHPIVFYWCYFVLTMEKKRIEAIIFDMDGVIIDSEPLWSKAEREVFSTVGVEFTDEQCRQTATMTTREVTNFWFERFPWSKHSLDEIENRVIDYVGSLIQQRGVAIDGIRETVPRLKGKGFKIGLATNSPFRLIPVVLEKIGIQLYFDALCSSEHEQKGKPHPDVYISISKKLGLEPANCLAIEDSISGIRAAKQAGMQVIALVTEKSETNRAKYALADKIISHYNQLDF